MAYQDTLSPSEVLSAEITATRKAMDAVARFFHSLAESASRASLARARYDTVILLQGKTDAELETLGLRREDIVRHVFGDLYYS